MEHSNFGPNVIYEAFWESDRNLKRSLQRSFEMQIWKAISLVNLRGEAGAHEAPYVALLIRVSRARPGESPGAAHTAAPLETELEPYKQSLVRE